MTEQGEEQRLRYPDAAKRQQIREPAPRPKTPFGEADEELLREIIWSHAVTRRIRDAVTRAMDEMDRLRDENRQLRDELRGFGADV